VSFLGTGNTALDGNGFVVHVIDPDQFSLNGTSTVVLTAASGGFWSPNNRVLLKNSVGGANLSGLTPLDQSGAFFSRAPFVLNSVNPSMMLLGLNGVYEDADPSAANGYAGDVIANITTDVGGLKGTVSALAYGGRRGGTPFTNVAFVGTNQGQLLYRGPSAASPWTPRTGGGSTSSRGTRFSSPPT
jgi:hypothetical protein